MTAVARMIEIWRMVLSSQSKHCSPDFFSRRHPAPTAASRHWYLPIRQKKFALRSFGSQVVGCESDDIAGSQRPIDVFDGHSRFLSHMLEGIGRLDRPPNVFNAQLADRIWLPSYRTSRRWPCASSGDLHRLHVRELRRVSWWRQPRRRGPHRRGLKTPISPTLARSNQQPTPSGSRGRLFRQHRPLREVCPIYISTETRTHNPDISAWVRPCHGGVRRSSARVGSSN